MQFKKLIINEWKQFENLEIEFHPELTVLTGANGALKDALKKEIEREIDDSKPYSFCAKKLMETLIK